MSAVCQVTGRKPGYGKRVSHSHRRSERRWIRLRVSAKGIKTIDQRGIEAVVADVRARGVRL